MQVIVDILMVWGKANTCASIFLVVAILIARNTKYAIPLGVSFQVLLFNWYLWLIYFVLSFLFLVFGSK